MATCSRGCGVGSRAKKCCVKRRDVEKDPSRRVFVLQGAAFRPLDARGVLCVTFFAISTGSAGRDVRARAEFARRRTPRRSASAGR